MFPKLPRAPETLILRLYPYTTASTMNNFDRAIYLCFITKLHVKLWISEKFALQKSAFIGSEIVSYDKSH